MSKLFSPISLRGLTLPNRIVVSPMCQYSAIDGDATDWHLIHLGQFALSGVGLLMIEATAVSSDGRITLGDLGLYSNHNEKALARVIRSCRAYSSVPIGIQLAHAGRKGSAHVPWKGGGPLGKSEGAWRTVAPSALPRDKGWPIPHALDKAEMDCIKDSYANAAKRAGRIGLDLIELHVAHGYLLHEFLSPISNQRTDQYGGSLENRMRFVLEIAVAIRKSWPADKPVGVRITGSDWIPGGLTTEDAVVLAKELKSLGFDYVCVSSGGIIPKTDMITGPGYQVPFAARVKKDADIATRAVGLINDPLQAEEIISSGKADMVALGRAFLDDPHWVWHAAFRLGVDITYPPQYIRGRK